MSQLVLLLLHLTVRWAWASLIRNEGRTEQEDPHPRWAAGATAQWPGPGRHRVRDHLATPATGTPLPARMYSGQGRRCLVVDRAPSSMQSKTVSFFFLPSLPEIPFLTMSEGLSMSTMLIASELSIYVSKYQCQNCCRYYYYCITFC